MLRLAALTLCLVAASGCDSTSAGTFDVALFDILRGTEAARVELTFDRPSKTEATGGTYHVLSGVLTGTARGTLRATVASNGEVAVQVDPLVADGGAELRGAFGAEQFEGTWTVGSFASPQPGDTFGTFRAARR